MNPVTAIAESYRRLRHTYGYGVHSPSAYKLICDVLRPRRGYSYYDVDRIEAQCAPGGLRRRAILLHRLAARYPFAQRKFDSSLPPEWIAALKSAGRGTGEGELVVSRNMPRQLPQHGVAALFELNGEDLETLRATMKSGILLSGRDAAILILNPTTRFVEYTVRI